MHRIYWYWRQIGVQSLIASSIRGYRDISAEVDAGMYVPPPVDDEYRDRRLTEFSPLH